MLSKIHPSWKLFFENESKQPYFQTLITTIEKKYNQEVVFPHRDQIFRVFETDLSTINVVILGQDPYPTYGYANGLCFSVNANIYPYPKSLLHIFREIKNEYPEFEPKNGYLTHWKEQGVFLYNTLLTVEKGVPQSHKSIGWEKFTSNVISFLTEKRKNIVYLLWGKNAHNFEKQLNISDNLIIKTSHPSPLGYAKSGKNFSSFKNSGQFHQCNTYLKANMRPQILW